MEFKGTKGKWGIDSKSNVIDCLGDEIAICLEWRTTSEANALLISKAPEMLEFIKSIVDDYENGLIEDIEHLAIRAELLYQKATEL